MSATERCPMIEFRSADNVARRICKSSEFALSNYQAYPSNVEEIEGLFVQSGIGAVFE